MKLARLKNRVYDDEGRIKSHSEYAIVEGQRVFAYLILNRGGWIAVQRSSATSFGKAVSPINLILLRDVKRWALERWNGDGK